MNWNAYRRSHPLGFRKHKELADKAIAQLDDDLFFRKPAEHSNSVAIIVKHLAGNHRSRWTDFFTTTAKSPSATATTNSSSARSTPARAFSPNGNAAGRRYFECSARSRKAIGTGRC